MNSAISRSSLLSVIAVFALGFVVGGGLSYSAAAKSDSYAKLDIFAKVLHYVETNYVEEVSQPDLVYGAIKGMLDTLDPHTVFMPPDVYREMKIDTTGEFQGLGLIIESLEGKLVVISPMEGTPAQIAGVQKGDVIVRIGERDAARMTVQEAAGLLRGAVGTKVTLTLRRAGAPEPLELTLTRGRIHAHSVEARLLEKGVGYVRIKAFQERTTVQFANALQKLALQSGGPLSGLALDLRDNPGGLLDEAVKLVDEFIEEGVIVTTEGRHKAHVEVERAHAAGGFVKGTLAVLIDGNSASAAEIVAGALQDHKRALLIGTKSFGKGSVQNIIDLDDGSGLKITVARYLTPSRRAIDGKGIMPDVQVVPPEIGREVSPAGRPAPAPRVTDETGRKLLARPRPEAVAEDDLPLRAAYAYLKAGKLP